MVHRNIIPHFNKINQIIRRYLVISCGLVLILLLSLPAQDVARGVAWPELEETIDPLVQDFMKKYHIVGMTVAVSRQGRLILSKGYGYAQNENQNGKLIIRPMLQDMRTRIGSVTKAVITGPVASQLLEEKGIDPDKKTLYGPNSIFGNQFEFDQEIGTRRYFPIVAMAIGPDDKVYTWYRGMTYSVGTSNDLDRYQEPLSYVLPGGYSVVDIRGIAISKSNKVYVWYANGTRSIGTPDKLDRYEKPDKDKKVRLPKGKGMLNIVGIAIAKSNDRVYVWYDDGTRSVGSSLNFKKYKEPEPYQTPSNAIASMMSPYNIRGIGISKKDVVYTWYSNDKVSSGTSRNLSRYLQPYPYLIPELPVVGSSFQDPNLWWEKITLRHLLTHRTGFERSGDGKGTQRMFNISENQLTYRHIHQHFLRTKPLRFRPGLILGNRKVISYSNHGFGLWTLIVPTLTNGTSYAEYALSRYLKPLRLIHLVRPMTSHYDMMDATPYDLNKDKKSVALPPKDSNLGLAAGGWTASAKSLLWITRYLTRRYTVKELRNMGWFARSGGPSNAYIKLHHNGLIGGGMAYVVIFPTGYLSKSKIPLNDIHVAIATNTSDFTKETSGEALAAMETLASQIALAVATSNVPASWNIWGGFPEWVRTAIPEEALPFTFEHGYQPVWIDGYQVNGKTYYNVILRPENGTPWVERHNLTAKQYQLEFNYWLSRGYRPLQVESYLSGNAVRYAVIFINKKGPAWQAYHGVPANIHQQRFNKLTAQGYRPVNISVVSVNGKAQFTALYEKQNVGSFVALAAIPLSQFQKHFDENRGAGRQLAYLNAWQRGNTVYFSAIWTEKPQRPYLTRHKLLRSQFENTRKDYVKKGFRTQFITGYSVNNSARFAAHWMKPAPKPKPTYFKMEN